MTHPPSPSGSLGHGSLDLALAEDKTQERESASGALLAWELALPLGLPTKGSV